MRLVVCTAIAVFGAAQLDALQAQGQTPERAPNPIVPYLDARVSGVYDTNLDHEPGSEPSIGAISRLAIGLQTSQSNPLLRGGYRVSLYRFTNTNRWNRLTHDFGVELAPRFGFLRPRLDAHLRLGSATEDREIADQLVLEPELELRFSRSNRVTLFAARRLRRFTANSELDETNRYAGVEYSYRWGNNGRWEFEGRYEVNEAERATREYVRWAGAVAVQFPLTRSTRLGLEVKYRWREFAADLVDIEGEEVPRVDRRWTPEAFLLHTFAGRQWSVQLAYELDDNASNDIGEAYRGHRIEFTIRRRL